MVTRSNLFSWSPKNLLFLFIVFVLSVSYADDNDILHAKTEGQRWEPQVEPASNGQQGAWHPSSDIDNSELQNTLKSILDKNNVTYEPDSNGVFRLTSKDSLIALLFIYHGKIYVYAAFSDLTLTQKQIKMVNDAGLGCVADNSSDGGFYIYSPMDVPADPNSEISEGKIWQHVNSFPDRIRKLIQTIQESPVGPTSSTSTPPLMTFEDVYRKGRSVGETTITSESANEFGRRKIEEYYNQKDADGVLLAQKIFYKFHPTGTVTRIRVHEVQGTWRKGAPSEKWDDIVQLDAIATLDWSGWIRDGWTKVVLHYDGQVGEWTTPDMLKTVEGAWTNDDVNEMGKKVGETIGEAINEALLKQ